MKTIQKLFLTILIIIAIPGFACKPQKTQVQATPVPGDTRAIQPTEVVQRDNLSTFTLLLQEGKYDQVASIMELPGKKYLLAGTTSSNESTGTDGYLVTVDDQGKKIQEKTYPFPGDQYFYNVVAASDTGYMILGLVKTPGREDWDLSVVKIDADLNQVWEKIFGGNSVEDCNELINTRDGGYIFAGHTDARGDGNYDFYIVKLGKSGAVEWEKTYGTEIPEIARAIIQTKDGGYLVAGRRVDSKQQVLVKKLNSQGKEQWSKTYGDALSNYVNSIADAADGSFLLTGMSQYNASENQTAYQIYMLNIAADGAKIREANYAFDGRLICLAQSIKKTLDGNFIIGGAAQHIDDVGFDFAILKIDPACNLIWKRTFTDMGGGYTNVALPVSDGGYLVGGYSSKKVIQDNQGVKSVLYIGRYGYAVKFNSNGGLN